MKGLAGTAEETQPARCLRRESHERVSLSGVRGSSAIFSPPRAWERGAARAPAYYSAERRSRTAFPQRPEPRHPSPVSLSFTPHAVRAIGRALRRAALNHSTGFGTATSHRTVPLWPQLKDILSAYLFAAGDAPADDVLLFPSPVTGRMLHEWRKTLDRIAVRAGFPKGSVRTKAFRHSFASARLQTMDNGAPVAIWTVSKELGHGSETMLKTIYGHLGQVRHRSDVVEYRVEQHRDTLADRLAALGI